MKRLVSSLCLIALLASCAVKDSGSYTQMQASDNHWYRIDAKTQRDAWWQVRILMGKNKASGVIVHIENEDNEGWHLLVRLIIL